MTITPLVLPLLLLATPALSDPSAIPREAIDRTWGALARSLQYAGTWSVALDDGRRLSGDRAVADEAETANRSTTRQRWVHLVSSTTADRCAIAVWEDRLYCSGGSIDLVDVHLPEGTGDRLTLDTAVRRHVCSEGSCVPERVGVIRTALRPARATLAQLQIVFARIHRTDLAGALGARQTPTIVRATAPRLVMDVRYAERGGERNPGSVTRGQWQAQVFDREVVEYVARVTIGPAPAQIAIEPSEVGRFVERCERGGYVGSCSAPQETCTREAR